MSTPQLPPDGAMQGLPAVTASAAIPFKPAQDSSLPTGPQWGLAIVLCAAALGIALYVLRRRGRVPLAWKRQTGLLNVLESRMLSAHVQLHVVRYGDRQLLLSVGPAGTQCLRDDPVNEEAHQ